MLHLCCYRIQSWLTLANQSVHENRIYSLKIVCGDKYPDEPPEVTFISKINLPCVDARTGKVSRYALLEVKVMLMSLSQVNLSAIRSLSTWKRDFTMETILIEIRRFMGTPENKKIPQPPEGTNF